MNTLIPTPFSHLQDIPIQKLLWHHVYKALPFFIAGATLTPMHRVLWLVVFVVLIGYLCWPAQKKSPPPPAQFSVRTITLTPAPFTVYADLIGTVRPHHVATLFAQVDGVLDHVKSSGSSVIKGTHVATIEDITLGERLTLARQQEGLAHAAFIRAKQLRKKGAFSQTQLEEKKRALISSQQALSRLKKEQQQAELIAPFTGTLGIFRHREGSYVRRGESIVSLYNPNAALIDVSIPSSLITDLPNTPLATIEDKTYPIPHIQRILDDDTHMCPAHIPITQNKHVFGRPIGVKLHVYHNPHALTLPRDALFFHQGKQAVYIVHNGKAERTYVVTGPRYKNTVEVKDGLAPGNKVIVEGQQHVHPGMAVSS